MVCADTFEFDRDRWVLPTRKAKRVSDADFSRVWTKRTISRRTTFAPKPTIAYAKRSSYLRRLRMEYWSLAMSAFDEVTEPTINALTAAEHFINGLGDGCLDFRLELSHDGEINFLYGDSRDLFHIHIDDDGVLSYYSRLNGAEDFGDDLTSSAFPHDRLSGFAEQVK